MSELILTEQEKRAGELNGKLVAIQLKSGPSAHLILYANVVDCMTDERGELRPKRVRVQRGLPELHGAVLTPGNYNYLWEADKEED